MAWLEMITALRDILVGGAAATTAIVALQGLKGWRRELKGKAEFETARGLIKATYKLRDEIRSCRSPFVSGHEFPEGYGGALDKYTVEEDAKAWAHVIKKRWGPVSAALQDFDAQTLEAEAIWGTDIRAKAEALRKCVHTLYVAFESFISDKFSGGENFKTDRTFGHCSSV